MVLLSLLHGGAISSRKTTEALLSFAFMVSMALVERMVASITVSGMPDAAIIDHADEHAEQAGGDRRILRDLSPVACLCRAACGVG